MVKNALLEFHKQRLLNNVHQIDFINPVCLQKCTNVINKYKYIVN